MKNRTRTRTRTRMNPEHIGPVDGADGGGKVSLESGDEVLRQVLDAGLIWNLQDKQNQHRSRTLLRSESL